MILKHWRRRGTPLIAASFLVRGIESLIAAEPAQNPTPSAPAAVDKPSTSLSDGLAFPSPWLNPGKLDFLYRHRSHEDQYNVFGWTPVFKGGGGVLDPDGRGHTDYAGGFFRPLVTHPELGDLVLGVHGVDSPTRGDYELQGEYRFPFGLGFGGGLVRPQVGPEIQFGKLTYRNHWQKLNYIVEAQLQDHGRETHPGGYLALYDEQLMAVAGSDGEQWRTCLGYVGPSDWKSLRPAIELLYVDHSTGNYTGPRSLFANVTFKFEGGFLSHPARLGRAMGPQGAEFGNPLGFLTPTWNRRLEVWEMGGLMDLRAEHIRLPNHQTTQRYEGLMFPGQWDATHNFFDHWFVGGSYSINSVRETAGVLGGFAGKVGFLKLSLGVDHEIDPSVTTLIVGAIDSF